MVCLRTNSMSLSSAAPSRPRKTPQGMGQECSGCCCCVSPQTTGWEGEAAQRGAGGREGGTETLQSRGLWGEGHPSIELIVNAYKLCRPFWVSGRKRSVQNILFGQFLSRKYCCLFPVLGLNKLTFYLRDRSRNVLLNSGKEILLAFSFYALLRKLKGKKEKGSLQADCKQNCSLIYLLLFERTNLK